MYTIRVKPGCMIVGPYPACREFRGGSVVTEGEMSKGQMEEHIRSGHAEPVNIGSAPVPDQLVERPPGMVDMPNVSSSDNQVIVLRDASAPVTAFGKKDPGPGPIVITGDEKTIQQSVKLTGKKDKAPKQRTSIWDLNPDDLADKDLDDLNAMVLERDQDLPLFETPEEAIAQLSKDFK